MPQPCTPIIADPLRGSPGGCCLFCRKKEEFGVLFHTIFLWRNLCLLVWNNLLVFSGLVATRNTKNAAIFNQGPNIEPYPIRNDFSFCFLFFTLYSRYHIVFVGLYEHLRLICKEKCELPIFHKRRLGMTISRSGVLYVGDYNVLWRWGSGTLFKNKIF